MSEPDPVLSLPVLDERLVTLEDVHVGGVEDQLARPQWTVRVVLAEVINDPLNKAHCKIDVILEVPKQVSGPHEVAAVDESISDDEVVPKSARYPLAMNRTRVLREPDGEVCLTSQRRLMKLLNDIVEVAIGEAEPPVCGVLIPLRKR